MEGGLVGTLAGAWVRVDWLATGQQPAGPCLSWGGKGGAAIGWRTHTWRGEERRRMEACCDEMG